ncbi:flagellar basal body P-ring formation chaperone FlgA [Desulfovibrio litoralis]|uniref:flagellar basal body P-ring formation chaperone FlgA n=1 Tax=Desulfovibrio litoralis TaxID=466107 RepID=UPI0015B8003B|nr:flagellar basal body P-ring formation chaperone FlgA [Desulfovibrio litoralis]
MQIKPLTVSAQTQQTNIEQNGRIRIVEAAIVSGQQVLLGEIAYPIGSYDQKAWEQIANTALWDAPTAPNKPMAINKQRLQQEIEKKFPQLKSSFIYPNNLALQLGGTIILEQDLISLTVKTLTPLLASMGSDGSLEDYKIPSFIFLSHPAQRIELEIPQKLSGGRLILRFLVKEPDNTIVKKISGNVFLNLWKEVPCASQPLNKEELLDLSRVTFIRKNLAHLKEEPWDGKNAPLRLIRPVGTNQVIYQSDVAQIPFIRKGELITLLYEGKSFELSIRGEALSDGFPGESIPVKNTQSNKQVIATVKDRQTVVVR